MNYLGKTRPVLAGSRRIPENSWPTSSGRRAAAASGRLGNRFCRAGAPPAKATATGAVALQNRVHYAARVMSKHGKRALVTGGAGLIGSHVTDLLVREGWKVRVLDNLEPNTHKRGKPAWINPNAGFIEGDLRDRETIGSLVKDDVDLVQAAYGGYMPEIVKFVHVNSLGTAQMLEVIREKNLPIKKIIVASSQAVYSEGAGDC